MMRRREFTAFLVATATAWPARNYCLGEESACIPRIGYLFTFNPAAGQHLWEACRQGLRELGYIEPVAGATGEGPLTEPTAGVQSAW
jgi:hypothetical protein